MTKENQITQFIVWLTLITGGILLIPLIAMQFTNEVVWTLSDFIFAGTMIFGTGLAYKLITRNSEKMDYRIAFGLACAAGFLLVWANGAVGIIGSEANPINAWYYGVPFLGLIGAFISGFQANKMTVVLYLTAAAQALIAAIAIFGGYYQSPPSSVMEIIGVNGFFIVLWIASALKFRQAASENNEPAPKPTT